MVFALNLYGTIKLTWLGWVCWSTVVFLFCFLPVHHQSFSTNIFVRYETKLAQVEPSSDPENPSVPKVRNWLLMQISQHMYWAVNSADVKAISSLLLIIWWAGRVDHGSFARIALAICIITPFPTQHLSIQISICLIFKVLPNVTFMLRTWNLYP